MSATGPSNSLGKVRALGRRIAGAPEVMDACLDRSGGLRLLREPGASIAAASADWALGDSRAVGALAAERGGRGERPLRPSQADADDQRPASVQDEAALTRLRSGDTEAYGELVRRYQSKVYSIACGFVGPGDDALDLTQDVFVKAYAELARFRGHSSFYTWLYRITVNMGIDRVRKASRERRATVDDVGQTLMPELDDPARIVETKELAQAVERAIGRLSPKLRTVMILHDAQGLSMHEVAQVLGCRPATVRTRLFRARAQVRDRVRGREGW
jgi:RNA polymerase sigma-70 factor (ECF subfamily)